MTASAMGEDRQECVQAGMDDYLAKPAKIEQIQHLLQRNFPGRLCPNPGTTAGPLTTKDAA
jgi:CheY-like chemotaxis protein